MLSALSKNSLICTHKDRYVKSFITSQQVLCTASTAKLAVSTTFFVSTIIIQHYCCFLSAAPQNEHVTLHPPGFCKMSKSNVLMRSKIHEDSINKTIHDNKQRCDWQRARTSNDTVCNGFTRTQRGVLPVKALNLKSGCVR